MNRAWEKYGEENFRYEVLCFCDKSELDEMERYYIKLFNSLEGGYNCTAGGDGMLQFSHSSESKAAISIAMVGKQKTDETKMHMSTAQTQSKGRPVVCSNGDVFPSIASACRKYGITQSAIRQCCNGDIACAGYDPNTGLRLSWCWNDCGLVINQTLNQTCVNDVCVPHGNHAYVVASTGDMFASLDDAAKWCGLKAKGNISTCCLHPDRRPFAGTHPITGEHLRWRHATPEEILNFTK